MKKYTLLILLLVTGALTACGTTKPPQNTGASSEQGGQTSATTSATGSESVTVDPLKDPNSPLAKRSVYYPLDVAVVQQADRPLIAAHAHYLATHPGVKVRLEGNCDERGSNEYNLALGQRRANGVKQLLIAGGASPDQIDAVSNGEEKPRLTCHAERCWKVNRRTDLIYSE